MRISRMPACVPGTNPCIGEIKILGEQTALLAVGRRPDVRIDVTSQSFFWHGLHIVTKSAETVFQFAGKFSSSLIFMPAPAYHVVADPPQPKQQQRR